MKVPLSVDHEFSKLLFGEFGSRPRHYSDKIV